MTAFPPPDATRDEIIAWEREAFYDREIAPKLLEVAKLCEVHEMSLVANVEWAPGKGGLTITETSSASVAQHLVRMAARCNGNVDALLMGIVAHARKHGHASVYLRTLGVPTKPEAAPAPVKP